MNRIPLHSLDIEKMPPLSLQPKYSNSLRVMRPEVVATGKLALPTMEGVSIEKVADIVSLEAKGNYTLIHFGDKRQLLVCKTLGDIESCLVNGGLFLRIHRSYSINLERLQRYIKGKGGHVVMDNGDIIEVSSSRKHELLNALRYYFGYE